MRVTSDNKIYINATTYLDVDGSGNLVLHDSVTNSKTLAQLGGAGSVLVEKSGSDVSTNVSPNSAVTLTFPLAGTYTQASIQMFGGVGDSSMAWGFINTTNTGWRGTAFDSYGTLSSNITNFKVYANDTVYVTKVYISGTDLKVEIFNANVTDTLTISFRFIGHFS